MRQDAVGNTGFRIDLFYVGEREDVGRVEEIHVGMGVAGRLRKAMIEAASAGAGDVGDDTVENTASGLITVESVIEECSQEASALGDAKAQRAVNRAFGNRKRVG